jgi:CBS domain-containing protein
VPVDLLGCVLAGLACGALSAALSMSLYKVEDFFGTLPIHWMWWPAVGGLAVGIGGVLEPRALGVGYDVINDLLHNQLALNVAVGLLAVKAVIWVIALGSGTSGGVLAPLLMMGAGLGVALSSVLPGDGATLWPLVCMAATLGGTMRAPLTATVFAFGLTHDANSLLPVMCASAVAYGFTVLTMRRSILTEKIARRGYHIYREYGIDPLERHAVDEVMTHTVQSIPATMTIVDALAGPFGPGQRHRAFPVVQAGQLMGVVDRAMLLELHSRVPDALVAEACARTPPVFALPGETCRDAASRLAQQHLERLPVVADPHTLTLVGIVSRSDLIKLSVVHFDEEETRERFRSVPWQGGP